MTPTDLPGEAAEYIADLLDLDEEETRGEAADWVTDYDALGLGPDSEGTRSSGPALWYPEATTILKMPTRGTYPRNYPVGAVVHFTAGRSEKGDADAENTIRYGASHKHCYFCISATGRIYQTAPLNRWGSHAGRSSYPGLGEWLSSKLVGIEVCGAGIVRQTEQGFEPSWNKTSSQKNYYTADQVRRVGKTANITEAGYYLQFTPAQEESLITLLRWLQANHPTVFQFQYVLGHDEIAPARKQDPGGSLSLLMPDLRARLLAAPVVSPPPAAPVLPVPVPEAAPEPAAAPETEPGGGFRMADLFVSRSRGPAPSRSSRTIPGGTRSAAAGAPEAAESGGEPAGPPIPSAVGAFVTPQSVMSFPIASGAVAMLSKLAKGLVQGVEENVLILGAASVIGLLIFLVTLSDPQVRPRTPLKWAIAILMALINTAFLAVSATGLGSVALQAAGAGE
jgi:N-acetyl-anhydromuramyl-L-alanine amidase AmpD